MFKNLIFLLVIFFIVSCELNASSAKTNVEKERMSKPNETTVWRKGEIRYLNFEGGFYGIFAQNGDKLLPFNLPREYLQHGAIIEFQGKAIKDMMTTKQWGIAFDISASRLIKPGSKHTQPSH